MDNEALLQLHGIRVTAIRLMILKCIRRFSGAFSFEEVSGGLDTVDRSTIFRSLSLFERSGLIHKFEDGLGHSKYCLLVCSHAHVSCKRCGKTFCQPIQAYPQVTLPENFEIEDINYVVTGLCQDCQKALG